MTPRNSLFIVTLLFVVSIGILAFAVFFMDWDTTTTLFDGRHERLVFLDEGFWPLGECEEGFGSLVLELQPGTLPYEDTIEIRGCVRVLVSGGTMDR